MRVSSIIAILLATAAVAWPHDTYAGQQAAGENSTVSAENPARQVNLAVLVRDKHGAPVKALAASDLTLTDNGRPQTIQRLTQESSVPLQLGLLVDTSRGMVRALDSQRKAAAKFVDLVLAADSAGATSGNQAFLLHFDHQVELLEDFTGSRDRLRNALEQLGPTPARKNTQGPETTDSAGGYGGPSNARHASPQLYDAIYLASHELMRSRHGRKALIVFGNGVDGGSKESINEAVDAAERAYTPVYTVYFRGDEQRAAGGFAGGRRGGWPGSGGGWPGGRGGGYPGSGGGGSRLPQADGRKIMEEIALRTGGLYFQAKKTANFEEIYQQIAADVLGQYLLSYTPDHSNGDRDFHKIALKSTRADLNVTAPEGYYSNQEETK